MGVTGYGWAVTRLPKSSVHCTRTNRTTCFLALGLVAILDGQKDLGIAGGGGVINAISLRIVKGVDDKVSGIHPSLIKILTPIAQNSLNG